MIRALLLVALGAGCAEGPRRAPQVGERVPPYAAVTLAGDSVDVASLRGRVVLLNVWATWCAPCRTEIPYLERLHQRHGGAGLSVIGVSVDAAGQDREIGEFVSEFGMSYAVWRDPGERIQALYAALGVPSTYLIDRRGVMRWKRLGIVRESDTTFAQALSDALGSGS